MIDATVKSPSLQLQLTNSTHLQRVSASSALGAEALTLALTCSQIPCFSC
ncbi:hypothetical protein QJS04_geneDACA022325 [Acorus gramineus]|uniref:Uncharacterized protein n=1 Tax=Acorus gramineus TaxID=55184 RepID=A0AAV9AJ23_ACOGR|nr:hypothetical protein QJS04_geneDACA022325 [Acorus gramineus]